MDVDGFDPWDFDDESWRDELQVMGEDFQEALSKRGITRRLRKPKPIDPTERVKEVSSELQQLLNKSLAPDVLPREMVECPACHGQGGVPVYHGNPSNGPDYERCDDCRGTGEIPAEPKPPRTFRFTSF